MAMTTRFTRQPRWLGACVLMIPLLGCLAAPALAASPNRERISTRCQGCSECAPEALQSRVVGLKIYNQPDIDDTGIKRILEMANRIWNPYGICVEPSTGTDAITVVISRATTTTATSLRPTILGDTLFSQGHATPYIHLWPANAEALATRAEIEGRPFISRSRVERDLILVQMLGVALAHELAHYLLDTTNHSTVGLLRGTLSVNDLAFPRPGHLRLTHDQQQQLICLDTTSTR
jgi:hypothetical protein